MTVFEKLERCFQSVENKIPFVPKVALILGSGLGDYGDYVKVEGTIDYHEIEGFPVSTVPGHKGRFLFAHIGNVPVVMMQGRVHYYEGYSMQDVVLPTRLMRRLGAEILFLTNAAGSVNPDFCAGDFMLIKDQISDFVPSPLIGKNPDELGPRFPDMSEIYDRDLQELLKKEAENLGISLREGTYLQFTGPNFESPAEVRMARVLGADAVGMSTACEAVAANHMGMKICGISFISNLGCGIGDHPLSHQEVGEAAKIAAPRFRKLVTAGITAMGETVLQK